MAFEPCSVVHRKLSYGKTSDNTAAVGNEKQQLTMLRASDLQEQIKDPDMRKKQIKDIEAHKELFRAEAIANHKNSNSNNNNNNGDGKKLRNGKGRHRRAVAGEQIDTAGGEEDVVESMASGRSKDFDVLQQKLKLMRRKKEMGDKKRTKKQLRGSK